MSAIVTTKSTSSVARIPGSEDIITAVSQLPKYDYLLTGRDGVLSLTADQRTRVALIGRSASQEAEPLDEERLRDGRQQVTVIWIVAQEFLNDPAFANLRTRLSAFKGARSAPKRFQRATTQIIASLYAREISGDEQDPQLESRTKAEFDRIAQTGYLMGASDIHLKVTRKEAFYRYRINGELGPREDLEGFEFGLALARTTYNALSDAQSRSGSFNPREIQDCVIEREYRGTKIRLRYAHAPMHPEGFKLVMRNLEVEPKEGQIRNLQTLGYAESHIKDINRAFAKPQGVVIIAGTTGSGKSTTLSTKVMDIARERPGISIITIEDPPEYVIPAADQIPVVRFRDGRDGFADAIRVAMRMDPDVLMPGEIRDETTAQLLAKAVQSGHQVLTTLHAGSAIECIARLEMMGLDRRVMSAPSFISGLMYQKLVPTLCPSCKQPYTKVADRIERQRPGINDRIRKVIPRGELGGLQHSVGCATCEGTGISGRTVCAEIIIPDYEILKAFAEGRDFDALAMWRSQRAPDDPANFTGKTALEHALYKMRMGLVSPLDVDLTFGYLDEQQHRDQHHNT